MPATRWDARFFASTRGRLVLLLRRGGASTVDELARALDISDNGVRAQLLALERDGLVEQRGVRRGGAPKPSYLYGLTAEAERFFPKAYAPLLDSLIDVLSERADAAAALREAGRRLGAQRGPAHGSLEERLAVAATLLEELGGVVELQPDGSSIRGRSCPLGAVVREHPEACQAVEGLLEAIIGAPVAECCQRDQQPPHCHFEVNAG